MYEHVLGYIKSPTSICDYVCRVHRVKNKSKPDVNFFFL